MASPQLENGHTRIANEILERIIASGLNGTELACIFFVLRKTYGFHKQEDEISLSQFQEAIPVSKETICTALSNLRLVKILRLVKKGNSKSCSNLWSFNKDYDKWQLVKKTKLVKIYRSTSQDLPFLTSQENLTHKRNYTKENTKERTRFTRPTVSEIQSFVSANGYSVDPEQFHAYYESNDWKVGKNKMKDWKASVRMWHTKNKPKETEYKRVHDIVKAYLGRATSKEDYQQRRFKIHPDNTWTSLEAVIMELSSFTDDNWVKVEEFSKKTDEFLRDTEYIEKIKTL